MTVARLAGACDLSSPVFALRGIDTRIAYASDATNFTAFLLDAGQGLEASAGFADAECTGGCAESQALVNKPGKYSLRVQADGGPYELVIQEYR